VSEPAAGGPVAGRPAAVDAGLRELLADLVSIDSVNPTLVPGGAGEGRIADHVAGWLRERGFEVHLQETDGPGRPNVIGVLRGTGGGRSLLLNGHVDTVGVAGMDEPHRPRIEDGRLYGRGAMDMKSGVAAMLDAAARAAEGRPRGDVIVTAVVDEEHSSIGTEAVLREWRADAAIVTEPTAMALTLWHRGFVWIEVEVEGVAAHGSRPDVGVDAIAKMGPILVGIDELGRTLAAGPAHPVLGTGSVHASLIDGGQELSSYPAACRLQLERRTIPGGGRVDRAGRDRGDRRARGAGRPGGAGARDGDLRAQAARPGPRQRDRPRGGRGSARGHRRGAQVCKLGGVDGRRAHRRGRYAGRGRRRARRGAARRGRVGRPRVRAAVQRRRAGRDPAVLRVS
jgi:acetylornithine deacetylase/succinyl-diaminopimelate desuccinylase-like protein